MYFGIPRGILAPRPSVRFAAAKATTRTAAARRVYNKRRVYVTRSVDNVIRHDNKIISRELWPRPSDKRNRTVRLNIFAVVDINLVLYTHKTRFYCRVCRQCAGGGRSSSFRPDPIQHRTDARRRRAVVGFPCRRSQKRDDTVPTSLSTFALRSRTRIKETRLDAGRCAPRRIENPRRRRCTENNKQYTMYRYDNVIIHNDIALKREMK